MDQELKAGVNSSPRTVTTEMWATLLSFISPFPMPVTPDLVLYMFDICTTCSLLPCIPYAAVLLLHCLQCIPLLEGWMSKQAYLVTIVVTAKFLSEDPPSPRDSSWSCSWFQVGDFKYMEAKFCRCLDWCIVISGPELESFSGFVDWFMMWV